MKVRLEGKSFKISFPVNYPDKPCVDVDFTPEDSFILLRWIKILDKVKKFIEENPDKPYRIIFDATPWAGEVKEND